jgi:exonuclease VII small subunit
MSKNDKTISENITEFENLVAWFDADGFSIEESIEKYKQIEKLAATINQQLNKIKNDINIIKKAL